MLYVEAEREAWRSDILVRLFCFRRSRVPLVILGDIYQLWWKRGLQRCRSRSPGAGKRERPFLSRLAACMGALATRLFSAVRGGPCPPHLPSHVRSEETDRLRRLGRGHAAGAAPGFRYDELDILGCRIDHLAVAVRFEASPGQGHWRCVGQPPRCDTGLVDDSASGYMFLGLLSGFVRMDAGQDERRQHALAMVRSAAEAAFPRLPRRKLKP